MLPGFRFLFAAIVLSMSILVFGLGAAALLRAAHEEVASNPSWRAAPETRFAQQGDTTRPVLAMLRVEPQPEAPKAPDDSPAVATAVEPATIAPAEPAASASTPAVSEWIAALKPDDAPPPESAKPAMPPAETPAQSEAPPPQADAPAPAAEAKVAASEQALPDKALPSPEQASSDKASPPANEAVPAVSEQISAPAAPDADAGATKVATQGDSPVIVETTTPAKAASAKPDRSAIRKRQQARRTAQRRRLAARARLAQKPLPAADPFAQPVPKLRTR